MSVTVEMRLVAPQTLVAAIVRNKISPGRIAGCLAVTGDRRACALLIRRGEMIKAFTPQGGSMPLDEIDRLCPGAVAQMRAVDLA